MSQTYSLDLARAQLAQLTQDAPDTNADVSPLEMSPWLAMSVMQKAIRRGQETLALRSASLLLNRYPERFWRRIGIIAFEDVGVADLETVSLVTAALKGKRWRKTVGTEMQIGLLLVARLARANKCRAAADLAVVCDWLPRLGRARREFASQNLKTLHAQFKFNSCLLEQALALRFALGTDRYASPALPRRAGDRAAAFQGLRDAGCNQHVVEVAEEGLRKCNEILPALLPLLHQYLIPVLTDVRSDPFPPVKFIGDIPSWAFDAHVRQGNQALARLLKTDCPTARWVNAHVSSARVQLLGRILFRIESGQCANRLRWPTGDELRHLSDVGCPTYRHENAAELMAMLLEDLPLLNEMRAEVAKSDA